MKLWQRYLLKRIASVFFFLLLCFFILYVLFDLSMHGSRFFGRAATKAALPLFLYYLQHFSLHLDLFSPLAFFLSCCKTFFDFAAHFELIALQTAGLSKKRLLLPFFLFAAVLSLISYANGEWLAPNAGLSAHAFNASHSKKKHAHKTAQSIALADGSQLIYQRFDPKAKEFFDVFWIRSAGDIWVLKTLSLSTSPPIGECVDHLMRDGQGLLIKTESFETHSFNSLCFESKLLRDLAVPMEYRRLSALFRTISLRTPDQIKAKTQLHRKLSLPLLPLAMLFAMAPFYMRFSRERKNFLLVTLGLFGLITCITLYESLVILAENRVLGPELAMWSPILLIIFSSIRRFWAL